MSAVQFFEELSSDVPRLRLGDDIELPQTENAVAPFGRSVVYPLAYTTTPQIGGTEGESGLSGYSVRGLLPIFTNAIVPDYGAAFIKSSVDGNAQRLDTIRVPVSGLWTILLNIDASTIPTSNATVGGITYRPPSRLAIQIVATIPGSPPSVRRYPVRYLVPDAQVGIELLVMTQMDNLQEGTLINVGVIRRVNGVDYIPSVPADPRPTTADVITARQNFFRNAANVNLISSNTSFSMYLTNPRI